MIASLRPLLLALLGASALVLAGATAPALTAPAQKKITRSGVGTVKLGKRYVTLRRAGALGKIRRGCPFDGPRTRSATLRSPLRGSVDFTRRSPRRVVRILISKGARARGVGVGSRQRKLRRAFPKARFDHRTDATFGLTLVRIPRDGGGRLQFAIDTRTKKVRFIGIPSIGFCE